MSWSSGPQLAEDIWNEISIYIPKEAEQEVAMKIIELHNELDADDWVQEFEIVKAAKHWENEDGED